MYGGNPNDSGRLNLTNFNNGPFTRPHSGATNPYGFGVQRVAGRVNLPEIGGGPQNQSYRSNQRSPFGGENEPSASYLDWLRQLRLVQGNLPMPVDSPLAPGQVGY